MPANKPPVGYATKHRDADRLVVFVRAILDWYRLYALTTLPLRRQDVQTRMCLLAAPTFA